MPQEINNLKRDMEAEDGLKGLAMKSNTIIAWQGDWESFKRRLKATGILNGTKKAMQKGEELAVKQKTQSKIVKEEADDWNENLVDQSERLAAILLLALEGTKVPQQSIVINRSVGTESNGIQMWADLIKHFEMSSREVRMSALLKEWERCTLKEGEHPNELYGKLTAINSKLEALNAGHTCDQLKMRFVSVIEQDESGKYTHAIQQYRGTQIEGAGWSLKTLLEFLTHIYNTQKPEIIN